MATSAALSNGVKKLTKEDCVLVLRVVYKVNGISKLTANVIKDKLSKCVLTNPDPIQQEYAAIRRARALAVQQKQQQQQQQQQQHQ